MRRITPNLRTGVCSAILLLLILFHHCALALPGEIVRLRGPVQLLHFDGFAKGGYKRVEEIGARGRRGIRLIQRGKPQLLQNGDTIMVRGRRLRRHAAVIYTASLEIHRVEAAVTGQRSVALVRITSADGDLRCSSALLVQRMWTGARNINGIFQSSSFGAFSFRSDNNGDGQLDVFDVTISSNTLGRCGSYSSIASEASAALSARGISLAAFNHVVYYLPDNSKYQVFDNATRTGSSEVCAWAGLAGGSVSYILGEYCGDNESEVDVVAHELGHNLGLGHAGVDLNNDGDPIDFVNGRYEEYDDLSCIMSYANRDYRHFNAPHKNMLGWLRGVQNVSAPGNFALTAEESPHLPADSTQMLVIPAGGRTFYVSFKDAVDNYRSGYQIPYEGKLSVHQLYTGSPSMSFMRTTLSDGQSFTDSSSGLGVSLISHSAGQALARVTFNCQQQPAVLTPPPVQPALGPGGAAQTISIGVTNSDSGGCTGSQFSLSLTLPSGISGSVLTAPFSLLPGVGTSATLSLSAAAGLGEGLQTITVRLLSEGRANVELPLTVRIDATPPAAPGSLGLN